MGYTCSFIQLLFFALTPFGIIKLFNKMPRAEFLGQAFWCYIFGFTFSLFPIINNSSFNISKIFLELSIPIALPFFIFAKSSTKKNEHSPKLFKSFFLLFISVVIVSVPTGIFFSNFSDKASFYSGMIAATYIGGTINMASLNQIFHLTGQDFLLMSTSDTIIGGTYLLILLTFMPKITSYILKREATSSSQLILNFNNVKICTKDILILCAFDILAVSLSYVLTIFFPKEWESVIFFIFVSLIAMIFVKKIPPKTSEQSTAIGNYLLMIFCLCIGSQLNFKLVSALPWYVFFLVLTVLICSILVHLLIAKFFQISRDIFLVSHTAGIYGPAFIAPITSAIKRSDLLLPGLAIAVLGNITGNYVGLLVQKLIMILIST